MIILFVVMSIVFYGTMSIIKGAVTVKKEEIKTELVTAQVEIPNTVTNSLEKELKIATSSEEQPVIKIKTVTKVKKVIDSAINMKSLGTFTVRGYCHCDICDKKNHKVAENLMVSREDMTVTVNPDSIPYGTKIWIDGVGIRQTQPSGHDVDENVILVYFKNHKDVKKFGEHKIEVYELLDEK